jgi:FdhE protein
MDAADQSWIDAHPYLAPLRDLGRSVDEALSGARMPALPPVQWDAYAPDHRAGVPLLESPGAALDVRGPGAVFLAHGAERMAKGRVPEKLGREAAELAAWLGTSPEQGVGAIDWLLAGGDAPVENAGLLRFLGWSALQRLLAPVRREYDAWRDRALWSHGTCPTCGADPIMGQLAGAEDQRVRRLACGQCATLWAFRRLACPFCGNEAAEKLEVLEIEEERLLRLDVCHACKGYVKTYTGEGEERLLLADWSTLHLDILAKDRGLERKGASLYEL